MTDYLDELADFVHSLSFADVPAEVVDRARLLVLDSLGVGIAGAAEKRVQQMASLLRWRGSVGHSSFLTGSTGDAADAAAVNAAASCAHVLDEGHKYARGHVGTYVLPAVLAVAEEREVDGAELLTAIVAGYEVAARLGIACRVREAMHPSGTWGTIGAAAAVARLMGFDPAAMRVAMNIAAPLTLATSWQAAVEGATVRDLYSGTGAANAVWAPRWAEAGFTGSHDDVSHVFGKVSSERFDAEAAADALGQRWEILRNYFKVHACCRNFQSGIDVALDLHKQIGASDEIVAIRAETFAVPARDNVEAEPRNVLAAKESFPVSLALALANGRCDQSVFSEESVYAGEVRRLAGLVEVVCDPELDGLFPEQRPTRLHITLKDGRRFQGYAPYALGDPAQPLSPAQLKEKFLEEVSPWLDAGGGEALLNAVEQLDTCPSLAEFMALTRPAGAGGLAVVKG